MARRRRRHALDVRQHGRFQAYPGESCAKCKAQPQRVYNRKELRTGQRVSLCDQCAMQSMIEISSKISMESLRQLWKLLEEHAV